MTIPASCDVVVIGGGPAGSTAASLLARDGYDLVLLEKASHPRFTVGESLLPHAWRFFDLLGVTPVIEREGFVAKQGGTVVWDGHIRQLSFSTFGFKRPGLHTERDRLDYLLLDHARGLGARVHEKVLVKQVALAGADGGEQRVSYHSQDDDSEGEIRCRYVIDASGQAAVLSRQLGMRRIDEDFRFIALWGYFEGSRYVAADGRVYPFERVREVPPTTFVGSLGDWGWAWHIPMRETTSVGLVIPLARFKAAKQDDSGLQGYFLGTIEEVPYLGQLLADARLVPGGFHVIRDYSYVPGQVSGPGYFIVGDAAAFVDPVFSLGVVLGLYSGHLSAWAIDRSLRDPARTANSRAIFTHQFRGRYELARAMAIPGRPLSTEDRRTAHAFLNFQSDAEQDLMYTAAMLTTRSANFNAISTGFDQATRLAGKYRELDKIRF
jgi:flavin-dependent dehydrogenase